MWHKLIGRAAAASLVTMALACAVQAQPTEGYLAKFSRRVPAAVKRRVPLRVSFPKLPGVDRLPATFGVPFPRGALKSVEHVRVVTDAGREVPCVVRRTATWERPDGDVRWALVDCSIKKGERYFLEFGAEVERAPASGLTVADGAERITIDTGALQLAFSKRRPVLIAGARSGDAVWLAPDRQKPMTIVDQDGLVVAASSKPEDLEVVVEQAGPLHAIVKSTGWFRRASGEKLVRYITRVHAFAGESFVRVVHTFVVAYDTDKVRLKDICLPFALTSPGRRQAAFGVNPDAPAEQRALANGYLLQDRYDHFALCSPDGKTAAQGVHAPGWFDVSGERGGLSIGLRHVWQEFPKELEVVGNEMRVHLWPPHLDKPLDFSARGQLGPKRYKEFDHIYWRNWYVGGLDKFDQAMGVAKTNELVLAFHAADRGAAAGQCMTLERPLVVTAEPGWMCDSDAFGRVRARGASGSDVAEHKMDVGFERFENFRRLLEDYGMIHYGDVHYEIVLDKANKQYKPRPWRWWASRFYGFPLVPWIMFVRSGDPRYLVFGYDNAKHVMDIDMCHVTNPDVKPYPKWRGGRYGGNGGIIHYGANMYPIGCDSHVEQLQWMYYLTGYRRAWDVMLEEGEYYLESDHLKRDGNMLHYAHRMTGGAMRTFIALYRATWDERYLKLAKRMAKFCYENQTPDGIIRYDDVYMAPGLFTYYQATGDKRMKELFLRCMRKQAQVALPMSDTRAYSFYGPAMAFFLTADPSYLGRSVEWMNQFVASIDETDDPFWRGHTRGQWDYCYLTVNLLYMPYLLEALTNCEEPVPPKGCNPVTGGEVLFRRDKAEPFKLTVRWGCYDPKLTRGIPLRRWRQYCKRHPMAARIVLRDANLREVAAKAIVMDGARKRLPETNVSYGSDWDGTVDIEAPAGKPGVYRLAIESKYSLPLKLLLICASLDKCVFDVSRSYIAFAKRYYFLVPKGRRKFHMKFKAQALRCELRVNVFDPAGNRVVEWKKDVGSAPLADYVPIDWDVPAGADGKLWRFTIQPGGGTVERCYVRLDGPPYVATSPAAFFVPEVKLPPLPVVKASPVERKAIAIPAKQAIAIERGGKKGDGAYERLEAKAGTIEFWIRGQWDPDELRDCTLLTCGQMRLYRRGCIGTYIRMGRQVRQSGFVMGAGRWYHIAIVWEPKAKASLVTDTRLYIDGVLFGQLNWPVTKGLGDWTGAAIRVGADAPMEIDDLRMSNVARYKADFDPARLPPADEHTLAQLDFEGGLPSFAKLVQ